MKLTISWPNDRGDTLVEVVFALAILSMVLTTSIGAGVKAFQLGQTARERTSISDEAQQHMEAVRGFRDNHTWTEFLYGSSTGPQTYKGVLSILSSGGGGSSARSAMECVVTSPCMHMTLPAARSASREYLPDTGGVPGPVASSYIEMVVSPGPGTTPEYVDITANYGFDTLGGGPQSVGHIKTRLSNIQFAMAKPIPTPGPGSGSGDTGLGGNDPNALPDPNPPPFVSCYDSNIAAGQNPWPGCFESDIYNTSDNPPGIVTQCTMNWADGSPLETYAGNSPKCQYGSGFVHQYPDVGTLVTKAHYPVTLTNTFNNGAPPDSYIYDLTYPW